MGNGISIEIKRLKKDCGIVECDGCYKTLKPIDIVGKLKFAKVKEPITLCEDCINDIGRNVPDEYTRFCDILDDIYEKHELCYSCLLESACNYHWYNSMSCYIPNKENE